MLGETINDWEYLGCAEETVPRTIASHSVFAQNMTIEYCLDICQSHNYRLAGLQHAEECWCGNTLLRESATGVRGCNMACKGDAEQICGGRSRLSVFEHKKYVAIGNAQIVHGYGYIGCFREKSNSRFLDGARVLDQLDIVLASVCRSVRRRTKSSYGLDCSTGRSAFARRPSLPLLYLLLRRIAVFFAPVMTRSGVEGPAD